MSSLGRRDARVASLYEQLQEIEERLIPTGLHVLGRAGELKERADLLRVVASFDRPEQGAAALPQLVSEGLGVDSYAELLEQAATGETRQLIDRIVAEAVEYLCRAGADSAAEWLASRCNVPAEKSLPTFTLLEKIAGQLDSNSE